MNKPLIPLVVITGPTASGKTSLSVELAKAFGGEIVSADSKQVYKKMDIATAVPTEEERGGIEHHLMSFLEPNESFSVADYVKMAKEKIEDIVKRGRLPFLVGGTGLYIDSLVNNVEFSEAENDYEFRADMERLAREKGGAFLLDMLRKSDPEYAKNLHENDVLRIIRALEVEKTTGRTMSEQLMLSRQNPPIYDPVIIGINYNDRQKLYQRIEKRVDVMVENGMIEEARNFFEGCPSKTSGSAIGHKELYNYLMGDESLNEALLRLKTETRRYAKRQLTWLRKNPNVNWIYADLENDLFERAAQIIENAGFKRKGDVENG